MYDSDTGTRVRFAANTRDDLVKQIRGFLRKLGGEKAGHQLSEVRKASARTAARIVGLVVNREGGCGYAEWARRLADRGRDNGPDRRKVALFGQPDEDVRCTLGDLLCLPKSDRIALWTALLARETGTPGDGGDPKRLAGEALTASSRATATDFDALMDDDVNADEARRMEADHSAAGAKHLQIAAWARARFAQLTGQAITH